MPRWKQQFEIREDYVAEYGGDHDVYIIFDKLSNTYLEREPGVTWYTYYRPEAIAKAAGVFKRNELALEKALLGNDD